jgi:hypothetical protein
LVKSKTGWRPKHHRFTEKDFRPYVIALGQLTLAWNDLHERLATLFWILMGGGWKNKPIGIWNTVEYDRPKRKLLLAALKGCTPSETQVHPSMVDEIEWIIIKANELEDVRNDAIHSPLTLVPKYFVKQFGTTSVVPDDALDNRRAVKLSKKARNDFLEEFKWCYRCTIVLRDYASQIEYAYGGSVRFGAAFPWPRRPAWPTRSQKKTIAA